MVLRVRWDFSQMSLEELPPGLDINTRQPSTYGWISAVAGNTSSVRLRHYNSSGYYIHTVFAHWSISEACYWRHYWQGGWTRVPVEIRREAEELCGGILKMRKQTRAKQGKKTQKRERIFNKKWKKGLEWLIYDPKGVVTHCTYCKLMRVVIQYLLHAHSHVKKNNKNTDFLIRITVLYKCYNRQCLY